MEKLNSLIATIPWLSKNQKVSINDLFIVWSSAIKPALENLDNDSKITLLNSYYKKGLIDGVVHDTRKKILS